MIDNYIGHDSNKAYYIGYNYSNNENILISVSKDKIELNKYTAAVDIPDKESQQQYKVTSYYNGKFYGYSYVKSYGNERYYSSNKIFSLDSTGKILLEKELEESNINNVIVNNNIMYVYSNNDIISTYDLDGNKKNSIKISDVTKFKYNNVNYYVNDNLVLRLEDVSNNTHYVVLDNELKNIKEIDLDKTDIDKNFEWSNIVYSRLNNDKVNNIYSVTDKVNESKSILLVFNK